MLRRVLAGVLVGALCACGVRTPAMIDVDALLARRGEVEGRRDLEIRVVEDPRDVQARLALAAVADKVGRPSQAIEQLEAVIGLGGPIGIRWRDADRLRLARLLAARGQARLLRDSPTALGDLERAKQLGATVTDDDLGHARLLRALGDLRHVDAKIRARGRAALATLVNQPIAEEVRRGSLAWATLRERAVYGAFLFDAGMRRAGWDELSAWHAAAPKPRELAAQSAYLRALAWWSPIWTGETPRPPASELVGPERCRFGACRARDAVGDRDAERAFVAAAGPPITDPIDAAAFVAIALRRTIADGTAWGPMVAAHVDLAALAGEPQQPFPDVPRYARPLFSRLVGRPLPLAETDLAKATPDERLVMAVTRILDGAALAQIRATLGPDHEDGLALLQQLGLEDGESVPPEDAGPDDAHVIAVTEYVRRHVHSAPIRGIRELVTAYRRDPAIAERLGRDLVAESADAGLGYAVVGASFDAIGDPARARAAWQAAVNASAEPRYLAQLAEAIARAGDADAALIAATTAAAASGDPAVVWVAVAIALDGVGRHAHALEAARSGLDLAGPDMLAPAFEIAIAASRSLGRDAQALAFAVKRARVTPRLAIDHGDHDPTDPVSAVAAYRRDATASTLARMWVASRWSRRDLAIRTTLYAALDRTDPRRAVIRDELVDLARWDPVIGRAAIAALR